MSIRNIGFLFLLIPQLVGAEVLYCAEVFEDQFPPSYKLLQNTKARKNIHFGESLQPHLRDEVFELLTRNFTKQLFTMAGEVFQKTQDSDMVVSIGNSMNPLVVALNVMGHSKYRNLPFSQPKYYIDHQQIKKDKEVDRITYSPFYSFQKKFLFDHLDRYFELAGGIPQKITVMDFVQKGVAIEHFVGHLNEYLALKRKKVDIKVLAFTTKETLVDMNEFKAKLGFPVEEYRLPSLMADIIVNQDLKVFAQYPSYIPGFGEIDFGKENIHFRYMKELIQEDYVYHGFSK